MYLMGFFSQLLDVLFPPKDTERIVREMSEVEFMALVSPTRLKNGVTSLLPYRHRLVRAVILEAKFKRNKKAISLLAQVLSDYLAALNEESDALAPQHFVIVPVPLGAKRLHERGYNQIEEIARTAGASTLKVLARVRDTEAQTTLSRAERLTNMIGAFSARAFESTYTYIILDDVVTTGATLLAAQDAFRQIGQDPTLLVALAH